MAAASRIVTGSPTGSCAGGVKQGIPQCVRRLLTRLVVKGKPVAVVRCWRLVNGAYAA